MTAASGHGTARSDGGGAGRGPVQRMLGPTAGPVLAARRRAGGSVMFHGGRDRGKTLDVSPGTRWGIAVTSFSLRNGTGSQRTYGDVPRQY
jgi:hypothetical protein